MCTLAMRENQPGQPCADVVQSDCHGATSPVIEMNTNRQKVTVNRTNCQVLAASYRRKNSCIKTSSLRSSETDPRRNAKKFHWNSGLLLAFLGVLPPGRCLTALAAITSDLKWNAIIRQRENIPFPFSQCVDRLKLGQTMNTFCSAPRSCFTYRESCPALVVIDPDLLVAKDEWLRWATDEGDEPGAEDHPPRSAGRLAGRVWQRMTDGLVPIDGGHHQHVTRQVRPQNLQKLDHLAEGIAAVEAAHCLPGQLRQHIEYTGDEISNREMHQKEVHSVDFQFSVLQKKWKQKH